MLSDGQLARLCHDLGLSEQARVVIAAIRATPPSRRVRSAAGNVSVRYPSRKMGVTIQAESHRNELAGVYEHEHDPATLDDDASARLRDQERRVGWGNARLASGEVLEREPQLCEVRDPRV